MTVEDVKSTVTFTPSSKRQENVRLAMPNAW